MRFFLLAIILALYIFPAGAVEKNAPCILKNAVFCGKWKNGNEPFHDLTITGKTLVWPDGMYAVCTVLKEEDFQEEGFEDPTTILECMKVLYFEGERSQEKAYYLLKAYKETNKRSKFRSIRLFYSNEPGSPYDTYPSPEDQASVKKRCPVFNSLNSECWEASSSPYYAPR